MKRCRRVYEGLSRLGGDSTPSKANPPKVSGLSGNQAAIYESHDKMEEIVQERRWRLSSGVDIEEDDDDEDIDSIRIVVSTQPIPKVRRGEYSEQNVNIPSQLEQSQENFNNNTYMEDDEVELDEEFYAEAEDGYNEAADMSPAWLESLSALVISGNTSFGNNKNSTLLEDDTQSLNFSALLHQDAGFGLCF